MSRAEHGFAERKPCRREPRNTSVMSQFKTFVLPSESYAAPEGGLNAFRRSYWVVSIVKTHDGDMWR